MSYIGHGVFTAARARLEGGGCRRFDGSPRMTARDDVVNSM